MKTWFVPPIVVPVAILLGVMLMAVMKWVA